MTQTLRSTRRPPGRPSRISREQIVSAALEILETEGLDGFAMNKAAHRVGVTTMALYKYFPSRDSLLDAVADSIYAGFHLPLEGKTWEDRLVFWLHALLALFKGHPIGRKLIKWGEHVTPAWLRVWLAMVKILADEGLAGKQLVLASNLVGQMAIGLIAGRAQVPGATNIPDLVNRLELDPADRALFENIIDNLNVEVAQQSFELGVQSILLGVSKLIEETR
jgi:TetR/AcrR family tetracycline transcriptional repressor